VVAMCCDYRLITEDGSIGLNEVALGISVPPFWLKLMARLVGNGYAERMLQFGKMLKSDEAKQVGLVDEIVSDEKELLTAAESVLKRFLVLPDRGRIITKRLFREKFSKKWESLAPEEAEKNWAVLSQPSAVKVIGEVLQRLSASKAKL